MEHRYRRKVASTRRACDLVASVWLYEVFEGHVRELVITHAPERN